MPGERAEIIGMTTLARTQFANATFGNCTSATTGISPSHSELMNGSVIESQATFYREADPAWVIVAQGDYDGDGRSDILWRNTQTGQVYRMRMNGLSIMEQGFVFGTSDLDWKLLGPATFPR